METVKEETVHKKIDNFIKDRFKKTDEEIKAMSLQSKMGVINMTDIDKWNEIKIELRKVGYII